MYKVTCDIVKWGNGYRRKQDYYMGAISVYFIVLLQFHKKEKQIFYILLFSAIILFSFDIVFQIQQILTDFAFGFSGQSTFPSFLFSKVRTDA